MAKMALKSSKKISTIKISKIKFNYGDGFIKIKVIKIKLQKRCKHPVALSHHFTRLVI